MKTDLNLVKALCFLGLSYSAFLLPIGTRSVSAQRRIFRVRESFSPPSNGSVSGTVTLPRGFQFSGTGGSTIITRDSSGRVTQLQLNPPAVIPVSSPSRTAAELLIRAAAGDLNNIEGVSAQIRTLGGINGLD